MARSGRDRVFFDGDVSSLERASVSASISLSPRSPTSVPIMNPNRCSVSMCCACAGDAPGTAKAIARSMAARYQYEALEFKETAHRSDGVFLPQEPGLPVYFLDDLPDHKRIIIAAWNTVGHVENGLLGGKNKIVPGFFVELYVVQVGGVAVSSLDAIYDTHVFIKNIIGVHVAERVS